MCTAPCLIVLPRSPRLYRHLQVVEAGTEARNPELLNEPTQHVLMSSTWSASSGARGNSQCTASLYCRCTAGDVARKYIKDPELLKFIDLECFIWSTVNADMTPMINAGMVFCDRHFGGINYPLGGVGAIAENMVDGALQLLRSRLG
eukprot:GHRQ01039492.1.p2 GENE.GHRQ01039492.1~~GHRQ01039492.1.p2  ORF type:complete len:147 (-),score=23.16 GHRQ01039492.1:82-522(-)